MFSIQQIKCQHILINICIGYVSKIIQHPCWGQETAKKVPFSIQSINSSQECQSGSHGQRKGKTSVIIRWFLLILGKLCLETFPLNLGFERFGCNFHSKSCHYIPFLTTLQSGTVSTGCPHLPWGSGFWLCSRHRNKDAKVEQTIVTICHILGWKSFTPPSAENPCTAHSDERTESVHS